MTRTPEFIEGPEASGFDALVTKIMAVPRAVILEREADIQTSLRAQPQAAGSEAKGEAFRFSPPFQSRLDSFPGL
jgi:hypothetical protein